MPNGIHPSIMTDEPLLSVLGLSKSFESTSQVRTDAVRDASFDIRRGEILVLAGESGSGKSTLARLLLGTIQRDSGRVTFEGRQIDDANSDDLAWVRSRCSFVQQDPYDSVNPRMSVHDIVQEPLKIHGIRGSKERRTRIFAALDNVGLVPEEISNSLPHELSGGQRQRVAIARALALEPAMIIADEPVSMLDVSIRASILELMQKLCDSCGVSFLYITHDLATARNFGDNIALMYRGRIVEYGPIPDVLYSPRHPYTQALLDALPLPEIKDRHKIRILDSQNTELGGCAFRARCSYAVNACSVVPKLERHSGAWDVACFAPLD